MEYRTLGRSGLLVSSVGLGCNNFGDRLDLSSARAVVDAAIDTGITFFDTADVYNDGLSETFLGEALLGRRDQVLIASKCGGMRDLGYGPAAGAKGSRQYLRRAVEGSLKRLKTDWIDLLQFHRPDPHTPISETLTALNEMIREGKLRYIGCCSFSAWQLAEAQHIAKELQLSPFISVQHQWSLLHREVEKEIVPAAQNYGFGIIPFFPLASGLLTGKVGSDQKVPADSRLSGWAAHFVTPENLARVEKLRAWADQHGRSLIEVAIGWLLAQPAISCVATGATSPGQIRSNVAAAVWKPTAGQVKELNGL